MQRFINHPQPLSADPRSARLAEQFATGVRQALVSNLVNIYLFGSRARGTHHPESDLDFLIETTTPITEDQRDAVTEVVLDLTVASRLAFDVHYCTPADLRPGKRPPSLYLRQALAEGVRL